MKQFGKWLVAALVAGGSFAVAVWLAKLALKAVGLAGGDVTWGIATSFGVAMAALAALWGKTFANNPPERQGENATRGPVTVWGNASIAIGGDNSGEIKTSSGSNSIAPRRIKAEQKKQGADFSNSTSANGDRSIAIGGNNKGSLSTGVDVPAGEED